MKGTLFAFAAVALFSLYVVFGKILLSQVSPFIILVLNQVLAGTILILVLDLIKRIRELKETSKHDLKIMYIISLFSAVGGPLLFLLGLKLTSATNTILIGKSEAILTSLLAIFFLKEKITRHQVIGGIVMFLGITIIATIFPQKQPSTSGISSYLSRHCLTQSVQCCSRNIYTIFLRR